MARTVNKQVSVYPKQRRFLESPALLRAFVGGIGSGKSHVGALDVIRRAKPGRLYLVTAPTYPMLADASFRSVANLARELELVNEAEVRTSAPPSIKLRTGAEIIFRSTDNPEMLRGPNLSGVWMDEASLSKREAFDILIGRLREGGELGWLTATFTPKGRAHWTYKVFGVNDPDAELIHATSTENPFLPKGFVEKVRKKYTNKQASQELEGLFLEGGGNHYYPSLWPRYSDVGDAYRVDLGTNDSQRWFHVRKADCNRLLALDWAMGKPKKSASRAAEESKRISDGALTGDCTAFVAADMAPNGLLFLLWCFCDRVPLQDNAPRLADACRRWHPLVVAGDDDNLSETMILETRRYKDIPSVKCLPIGGRNKLVRSQAAIVRAERGLVLLPHEHGPRVAPWTGEVETDWVELLSDQLESFTGADGEQDDIADAVSLLGRLADEWAPGEQVEEVEPELGAAGFGGEIYVGPW